MASLYDFTSLFFFLAAQPRISLILAMDELKKPFKVPGCKQFDAGLWNVDRPDAVVVTERLAVPKKNHSVDKKASGLIVEFYILTIGKSKLQPHT